MYQLLHIGSIYFRNRRIGQYYVLLRTHIIINYTFGLLSHYGWVSYAWAAFIISWLVVSRFQADRCPGWLAIVAVSHFDGKQAHCALSSFIQSISGDCLRVSDSNDMMVPVNVFDILPMYSNVCVYMSIYVCICVYVYWWWGAHILCEYRPAPGAILHAGTERASLRVRFVPCYPKPWEYFFFFFFRIQDNVPKWQMNILANALWGWYQLPFEI